VAVCARNYGGKERVFAEKSAPDNGRMRILSGFWRRKKVSCSLVARDGISPRHANLDSFDAGGSCSLCLSGFPRIPAWTMSKRRYASR